MRDGTGVACVVGVRVHFTWNGCVTGRSLMGWLYWCPIFESDAILFVKYYECSINTLLSLVFVIGRSSNALNLAADDPPGQTPPFQHCPLPWRHNGRDCVSNHQPHDCLLNRLFGNRSKKTSKLCVTGLCAVPGEFPEEMASNAENVSIWWRHHAARRCGDLSWRIS